MLNQAVAIIEETEKAAESRIDVTNMSTEELLDQVDGYDLFTPVALKIFMAKAENEEAVEHNPTQPRLVGR